MQLLRTARLFVRTAHLARLTTHGARSSSSTAHVAEDIVKDTSPEPTPNPLLDSSLNEGTRGIHFYRAEVGHYAWYTTLPDPSFQPLPPGGKLHCACPS